MSLPEGDWRHLVTVQRAALQRYCDQQLDACAAIIRSDGTPHERYLRLRRSVNTAADEMASAFNDVRRATAVQRLASLIRLRTVTEDELIGFSAATREAATTLADLLAPPRRRDAQ